MALPGPLVAERADHLVRYVIDGDDAYVFTTSTGGRSPEQLSQLGVVPTTATRLDLDGSVLPLSVPLVPCRADLAQI